MADSDGNYEQVEKLVQKAMQNESRSAVVCYALSHYYAVLTHGQKVPVLFAPEGDRMQYCPRTLFRR